MIRHHADIAGRHMSWLQAGHGSPVVLLHAFPLHAGMWQPQLETVPHGWTLIAPDLRGFGQSRGPAARSVDDHAADVLALLRHLNIEQAVIGGLSMGGYITMALTRTAPQRCRAVLFADTRAEADTPEIRANREKSQAAAREQGTIGVWSSMEPKAVGPDARANNPEVVARLREIALSNEPQAVIDCLEALKTRPDSRPGLRDVTAPAIVIVGEDDDLTPPAVNEAIQRELRDARLVLIPRAGHMSNMEQPEAFNHALWTFVTGLRDRTTR